MTATTRIKRLKKTTTQKGFSMMQLIIVLAVVSVVSALAFLGIASAKQQIRLTNSARLLASYAEKARVDSVRRHPMTSDLMAGIEVLDKTTYRVKMDFDGDGTMEIRDIALDSGVEFASDPIALLFDWRGRLVDLPSTDIKVSITLQWGTDENDQRYVDVTRSGDITIDSDVYIDDVPNVNVTEGLTGVDSGSTLNGNNTATPTPTASPTPADPGDPHATPTPTPEVTADPTPTPGSDPTPIQNPSPTPAPSPSPAASPSPSANPSPVASPVPTPCVATPTTNPSPFTFSKQGSGTVSFTVSPSGTVTFTGGPNNLSVTKISGNVFIVQSLNNARGNFTINFATPCGARSVSVNVTN